MNTLILKDTSFVIYGQSTKFFCVMFQRKDDMCDIKGLLKTMMVPDIIAFTWLNAVVPINHIAE